jgi:hypothetical protein
LMSSRRASPGSHVSASKLPGGLPCAGNPRAGGQDGTKPKDGIPEALPPF